jgi:hypothetical protein
MHRVPRIAAAILLITALLAPVSASASSLPVSSAAGELTSLCQPLYRLFERLFGRVAATASSPSPRQPAPSRDAAAPPTGTSSDPSALSDGGAGADPNG